MGADLVYLQKPNTKKFTSEGAVKNFYHFSTSSMQGWRHNMEDAHICNPNFD